jgi:hypothetical protein
MDLGILRNSALVRAASKGLGKGCALVGCVAILNGGKRRWCINWFGCHGLAGGEV